MYVPARHDFQQTAIVLLLALIVRSTVLYLGAQSLHDDPDSYARLAVNWSQSGVFGFEAATGQATHPTAFRPPLYPWLLSWFAADGRLQLTGVALLHLAMGLASVWLTLTIGRRLGLRWTPIAAMAVALDPLLLRGSQLLMTETLATLLALVAWRLLLSLLPERNNSDGVTCKTNVRSSGSTLLRSSLLGLVFGLAILARPTAAPWAGLCAVSLMFFGEQCWKRRLATSLIVMLGIAACVVPWTLRNLQQLGRPIWATSHGGYTLLLANNPSLYQHFINNGPSRDWAAEPFHTAWAERGLHEPSRLLADDYWLGTQAREDAESGNVEVQEHRGTELADDALAYSIARATIARYPGTFAISMLYRMGWFWAPWPNESLASPATLAIGIWYSAWFVFAFAGLFSLLRTGSIPPWLPALFLILALTAVHSIYWSNMRFRSPLMPSLYLLALEAPCLKWFRLKWFGARTHSPE